MERRVPGADKENEIELCGWTDPFFQQCTKECNHAGLCSFISKIKSVRRSDPSNNTKQ